MKKLSKKTAMRAYCYAERVLNEALYDRNVSPELYEYATKAAIFMSDIISRELGNEFVCDCILAHEVSTL